MVAGPAGVVVAPKEILEALGKIYYFMHGMH